MNNFTSKREISEEERKMIRTYYSINMLMFILKIDLFLIPLIIYHVLLFKYQMIPNNTYTTIIPTAFIMAIVAIFYFKEKGMFVNRRKLFVIANSKSNVYEIEGKLTKDKRQYKISGKKIIFLNRKEVKSINENDYIRVTYLGEEEPYFVLEILTINNKSILA